MVRGRLLQVFDRRQFFLLFLVFRDLFSLLRTDLDSFIEHFSNGSEVQLVDVRSFRPAIIEGTIVEFGPESLEMGWHGLDPDVFDVVEWMFRGFIF